MFLDFYFNTQQICKNERKENSILKAQKNKMGLTRRKIAIIDLYDMIWRFKAIYIKKPPLFYIDKRKGG